MGGIFSRVKTSLKHAWSVFSDENIRDPAYSGGYSYGYRQDRSRLTFSNERSIIASIFTRIAIDVSSVELKHVRKDSEGRYSNDIVSGLNDCLTVEPNIDQGPRQFRQDMALTLFGSGVIAIVPTETTLNPSLGSFDINSIRVGEVVAWFPDKVRISLYNEKKGYREEITLDKKFVALVENPMYSVMNETNSTLQRLLRKLNLLDGVDEQTSSGKLDIMIQLPYVIKSEARREQANQRLRDIEFQMKGSQYGIAYVDGTEKVTQLNRPSENNLLKQIEYLTGLLYSQLGLTESIMNGTADEPTMLNYIDRTVKPVVEAIVEAMRRAFLTKTARTQGQSIMYFRDPFKFVPTKDLAELFDVVSRNEILTPNELREAIGFKPSSNPKADELLNSNMPTKAPPESKPLQLVK